MGSFAARAWPDHPRSQHTRAKRRIAIAIAAGLLVNLFITRVKAQSQHPQYVTTVWQTERGLPQNSVNAIVQDQHGYLWIGTFGGLARFDGERFTIFSSADTPGFSSDKIFSLYESRPGVLWVSTVDGGLIRLQDGVATMYSERDGLPSGFISSIRGDAEGNVWINTSRGVARFAGTKLEAYPTHRRKAVREFFLQARDGSMWFRCGEDVVRFGADGSIAALHPIKPSVFLVHEAHDGSVWIVFRDQYRLVRYDRSGFSDVPLPPVGHRQLAREFPVLSLAMTEDVDGELLLLTPAGLCRIVNGRLGPPEALPLPANGRELPKVRSLLADREGDLWIGTIGMGLVRLRRAPLTAYGKDEGLSDASFSTAFQDREGRIWLGGDLLYWFDGHRFRLLPGVVNILTIAQTRDGDLWFGGYGGVYRFTAGVLSHFKVGAPAVRAIYQDREGTLWFGALTEERPGGLYRFREGKLEQVPGISDVRAIAEDRDGGLWLGGLQGLRYMRGSKTVLYDQKQGLSSSTVYDIHQDSTGTLWVATYGGGLNYLRDGRIKAITTKAGLPSNMLLGILDDGNGNLWLSANQGIFRLSLKELNDFADGKIASISPVSYGVAEGMRSSESNDGSPAGWKTTDGLIWFPTLRGVVAIDPTAGNRLPPPVVLEEASANKLTLAGDGQTSVPPGNHTFDFRFTALSLSAPEKLRFKYRLEPFDKDWVDAGMRRTAHYTNMAPGKYSFEVVAANSYGIWSDHGASVRFLLQPHFYQTLWFRLLLFAGVLLFAYSAHRVRIRRLQAKAAQLKRLVDSRTVELRAEIQAREGIETELRCAQAHLEDRVRDRTAELRRSEAYLAEAQRLSRTGSWALDVGRGAYAYCSEECLRIYGFDPREALPTREAVFQRIHPEDRNRVEATFEKALREKVDSWDELRIVLPDGTVKCVHVIRHPVLNDAGDVVTVVGTAIDITERKRAEEALRESETRFRTFVDHAADAFFILEGEQGTIVDVNRPACESLGYSRDELIGMTPIGFDVNLDRAAFKSVTERTAAGETVLFDRHWHRRKDGSLFPVEAQSSVFWHGGRRFVLKIARDITDRLRAEEAVLQSEKQLREIVESIPVIAFVNMPDGNNVLVNKRWTEYSGLSAEATAGSGWFVAIHPAELDRHLEIWRASGATGTPFEHEVRFRAAHGEYRWFLVRAVPLHDTQGNVLKWYGILTDIEDRKRAEERLQNENVVLREEINKAWMFEEIVGASPPLQTVLTAVSKVAAMDSTVLISGETGTGKELIARAIHKNSRRSSRPFVTVNCAAIPQNLIASELFGHEKGAFTGATQRHLGRFELAEGGTIFLDEIGDLPAETQVALLRVLQEHEFERVGGTRSLRADVRVIAATNRDLQAAITTGAFRSDLYYRLNVFPIQIPPLRKRREDIPVLVQYFAARYARKTGKDIQRVDKSSLELLQSYPWPGNVRELQNVIERSVILCETETLSVDGSWLSPQPQASETASDRGFTETLVAHEKEMIEGALRECGGRVFGPKGAAVKLGMARSTLESKIRSLKIDKNRFKAPPFPAIH